MYRLLSSALLLSTLAVPGLAQSLDMTHDAHQIKAGSYMLDKAHGKITWSVQHLGFSTYVGQFVDTSAKLTIDPAAPERTVLNATVKTASVTTSNDKLDDELKSDAWLNTDKFPTATFEATRVDVPSGQTDGLTHADVAGNLTIDGVTKPEVLHVAFNQAGTNPIDKKYRLGFTGVMSVKRSEFGVTKYVPLVGDDVALQIEGEFVAATE